MEVFLTMRNKTIKKITTFAMGIVLAGATVLTPTASYAKTGDPSHVSGSLNGLNCSGYVTIDTRKAVAETSFSGGGQIIATVTLISDAAGKKESHYASDYKAGGTARAVARVGSGIELTKSADGYHKASYGAYSWERTTHKDFD